MLDAAGFPHASDILPGNVSGCGALAETISRLRAECDPEQPAPTVVMDSGIATEANRAWRREQGHDWICVNRGRRRPPEGKLALELLTSSR